MKKLVFITLLSLAFVQCKKEKDPFAITNGEVGLLTKDVQIKQIDSLFATDSIVKLSSIQDALGTQGEVEIFEKGGKKLMLITPEDENDPNSTISYIQLFDGRYKTEKGLSPTSTFKDVKANYTIENVQTTINAVVVFLKESDIYLTIDKKYLPEEIRFDMSAKVEASQIPDSAPFKYFMVGWDDVK